MQYVTYALILIVWFQMLCIYKLNNQKRKRDVTIGHLRRHISVLTKNRQLQAERTPRQRKQPYMEVRPVKATTAKRKARDAR